MNAENVSARVSGSGSASARGRERGTGTGSAIVTGKGKGTGTGTGTETKTRSEGEMAGGSVRGTDREAANARAMASGIGRRRGSASGTSETAKNGKIDPRMAAGWIKTAGGRIEILGDATGRESARVTRAESGMALAGGRTTMDETMIACATAT